MAYPLSVAAACGLALWTAKPQAARRFWKRFSGMYPFRTAVRPVFLLPDRHEILEPIDGIMTRLKSLGPMRTTDSHGDAYRADLQVAEPMDHGHFTYRPAGPGLALDLGHLLLGHPGVRF